MPTRRRRATPCRAPMNRRRRDPPTPRRWARSGACCTPGSNGMRRTKRTPGPRRWRRACSSGTTWTRSCCSASRGTTKPRSSSKDALAASPDYLPARVKLADALFETGRSRGEPASVRDAGTGAGGASRSAHFGLGRIAARDGRHDRGRCRTCNARSRCFPSGAPRYYALALSYRALGRRDEAQRALERHAQYGPRMARAGRSGAWRRRRRSEMMRGRFSSVA